MIARRFFNTPAFGWRSPFSELERIRQEMERLSKGVGGEQGRTDKMAGVFPALNLSENKENYYVRAELPGLVTEDLSIQADGKSLSISGEIKPQPGETVKYHRRERQTGKFSRIIDLPDAIDLDNIVAGLNNGILTVTLPKSETHKPRQITVS
ncbi:MAG: Hsp20/alpha crystallin family protein [Desulfobacteraceae bacterium]